MVFSRGADGFPMETNQLRSERLSRHVLQIAVPTPTLPPAYETNTYVIASHGEGLVIDAGSADPDVLFQLVSSIRDFGVNHVQGIVATHYHRDHTQGMPDLQRALDAPILVHPLDLAQALAEMQGNRVDLRALPASVRVGDCAVEMEHWPGHTHGHIHVILQEDSVILVGDHLAGDGSVWIGPPDGHMDDYFAALDAIAASECRIAGPGHGPALQDAGDAARKLKVRRQGREDQIVEWLAEQPAVLADIVRHLYGDTVAPEAMWVAERTVQAHMIHLLGQGRIRRLYEARGRFLYDAPEA